MEINFSGKVVLVTGASSGIGEATAILFAKVGAKLALVGRNAENLAAVAKKCKAAKGQDAFAIVADIATDAGCEKIAKDTIAHFGRLDVLVNNAGVGANALIETADMESFDRVFSTNVRGVYNLTRLLVQDLIKTKGNIINVSSIGGTWVQVVNLCYRMTKAALNHFTRLTALELAPKGVRVNTVSPGITDSKFVHNMTPMSDQQYNDFLEGITPAIPMGKACVGEDIAKTIVFLASEHSALTTGTNVEVDGGLQFSTIGGALRSLSKKNISYL